MPSAPPVRKPFFGWWYANLPFPVIGWFMTLFYPHYMYSVYLICIHTHILQIHQETSGGFRSVLFFKSLEKHDCGTETRIHTILSSRISSVLMIFKLFSGYGVPGYISKNHDVCIHLHAMYAYLDLESSEKIRSRNMSNIIRQECSGWHPNFHPMGIATPADDDQTLVEPCWTPATWTLLSKSLILRCWSVDFVLLPHFFFA